MTRRQDPYAWKRRVARERRRLTRNPELAACWLCGDPIDMELPPLHPRAFSLDHIVPIGRGGDTLGEARPAHRSCNSSRGDGKKRGADRPTLLDW